MSQYYYLPYLNLLVLSGSFSTNILHEYLVSPNKAKAQSEVPRYVMFSSRCCVQV
jgi:hypothetical protein